MYVYESFQFEKNLQISLHCAKRELSDINTCRCTYLWLQYFKRKKRPKAFKTYIHVQCTPTQ